MYDTRNIDATFSALLDLTGCLNSPRQDDVLLSEAGVSLDRALFPLLVRLSAAGAMSVAQLADRAGRDPSTISRQLAKLEQLGLVKRPATRADMRVREAAITKAGTRTVAAITEARRRLLGELLEGWSVQERQLFPQLLQRLADTMKEKLRTLDSVPTHD
jgi:DNA-binding MarR family transcriptional regulator